MPTDTVPPTVARLAAERGLGRLVASWGSRRWAGSVPSPVLLIGAVRIFAGRPRLVG